MAVKEILQLGNPLLHQIARQVDDDGAVRNVVQDLADTLDAFRARAGFGRGIAAPQIGAPVRVLFVRMPAHGLSGALINPRIERISEERFELWDDCFSFPDLMVRVSRARRIRVAFRHPGGAAGAIDAEGDLSELLQHEIDHLDGILAVQRAISPTALCTRAEWERRYRPPKKPRGSSSARR